VRTPLIREERKDYSKRAHKGEKRRGKLKEFIEGEERGGGF